MDLFYIITLVIAVIFLIILLTIIGLLVNKPNNVSIFPPSANSCPDYWGYVGSGTNSTGYCAIPAITDNNRNMGSIYGSSGNLILNSTNTPGFNSASNTINFADAGWNSQGKTAVCQQKTWATQNNIIWDGITNYNSC